MKIIDVRPMEVIKSGDLYLTYIKNEDCKSLLQNIWSMNHFAVLKYFNWMKEVSNSQDEYKNTLQVMWLNHHEV